MGAVGRQNRGRVGADREEGDETEIEKAGESDLEIEPHPHQDVEPDEHHHLPDIRARDDGKQDEHENEKERPRRLGVAPLGGRKLQRNLRARAR